MTAQQQMKAEKGDMKVTMKDLPAVKESATAPVVIQKGGDTNTQVAQAKTDIHSGKLDTGVDSYHDRHAFAARPNIDLGLFSVIILNFIPLSSQYAFSS